MKKYIVIFITVFALFSCNGKQAGSSNERTLTDSLYADATELKRDDNKERRLRYLFFANGGLIGYFDDGTMAGCPRCDLLAENIETLYRTEPAEGYTVETDGSLLTKDGERLYPKEVEETGFREWAMIDYKWIIEPEGMEEVIETPVNPE